MMTLNKIPFKEVNGAGLFVDTVYEGGSDKNISSEVISKLLHVGNSGGFRKCMKVEGGKKTKAAAYVCIYKKTCLDRLNLSLKVLRPSLSAHG